MGGPLTQGEGAYLDLILNQGGQTDRVSNLSYPLHTANHFNIPLDYMLMS